jgi:hypothetical protein
MWIDCYNRVLSFWKDAGVAQWSERRMIIRRLGVRVPPPALDPNHVLGSFLDVFHLESYVLGGTLPTHD